MGPSSVREALVYSAVLSVSLPQRAYSMTHYWTRCWRVKHPLTEAALEAFGERLAAILCPPFFILLLVAFHIIFFPVIAIAMMDTLVASVKWLLTGVWDSEYWSCYGLGGKANLEMRK